MHRSNCHCLARRSKRSLEISAPLCSNRSSQLSCSKLHCKKKENIKTESGLMKAIGKNYRLHKVNCRGKKTCLFLSNPFLVVDLFTLLRPTDCKVWGSNPGHAWQKIWKELSASCAPLWDHNNIPEWVPESVWKLNGKVSKWRTEGSTDGCRYISRKEETRVKFNGRGRRANGRTRRYGRRRERRWTPTRTKAQDTRASPNSL